MNGVAVGTVDYEWRLREMMSKRHIFSTTKLIPLLAQWGVELSTSQAYRLATEKPERLNLSTLAALLKVLECRVEDLWEPVYFTDLAATGTDGAQESPDVLAVIRRQGVRPPRARVISTDGV